MAVRIVLVDPGGRMARFPVSRYRRLFERDSRERVRECAGGWARFAEAVVELVDRKPIRIAHIGFHQFKIGADGRPNPSSFDEQLRLAIGTLGGPRSEGNLLSDEGLWAKKALKDRFRWTPTPFQVRTIRRLLLAGR
jgi:hypothetical protein